MVEENNSHSMGLGLGSFPLRCGPSLSISTCYVALSNTLPFGYRGQVQYASKQYSSKQYIYQCYIPGC